jgi:DNA gyrase inhibitor GyrI
MPAGRYAVFRYEGRADGVGDAYREIYSCWFRESSLSPEDYVPFDHYVADFPRDGQIELEMWLRVRARR